AVLLLDVRDDRRVELVATGTDRLAGHDAAEGDDRDLGRATADVDDHVAGRLVDREPGADRRSHGLLDDEDLAGARLVAGVLDRALLHTRDAGRHADHQARAGGTTALVH